MQGWSEQEEMVRGMVRRWVHEALAPSTVALEKEEILPYELMREFAKTFGLAEMVRDAFEGGAKGAVGSSGALLGDPALGAILAIEISRENPGFMLAMGASMGLAAGAILRKGTPAQRARWGPSLLTFERIGAWAMTEPGAGSDAFGSMRTTARRVEGGYVLSGSKTFITNAPYADVFVVYAKLLREGTDHRPMHAFVVERGTAGLRTGKPLAKMGMHSSPTGEVFLDDVLVPASQLLGESEEGHQRKEAKDVFYGERTGMTPMCVGIAERCLEDSLAYARSRVQFGKPIAEFQLVQEKLARMYVHLLNMRNLLHETIRVQRAGGRVSDAEASACKLYCARATTEIAMEAVQLMGGNGYMQEFHVERLARDAKLLQIGGGTDEIQILAIARDLLASPT
jgi:acyl-CoA dehydrogenase